jgi:hypothetical protein
MPGDRISHTPSSRAGVAASAHTSWLTFESFGKAPIALRHKNDSRVRLKTQKVAFILIFLPVHWRAGSPHLAVSGVRPAALGIPWQQLRMRAPSLVEFFAATHDEECNHDEKTDSCNAPDNRNVVHGGLLSEANL